MVQISVSFSPDGKGDHWYSLFIEGNTAAEVYDALAYLKKSLPLCTFYRVSDLYPSWVFEPSEVN